MTEPVQLAKAAREQLAAALNALQTADVPDELVDAAEPVAQAMGVLHRIERTNGENLEGRESALEAVRTALGRVQKVEADHPAVEKVMEAIAGSLSKVHALVRYKPPVAAPAPAPPAPAPAPPAPAPVAFQPAPVPAVSPGGTLPFNQTLPVAAQPVPQDAPQYAPQVAPPAYAPQVAPPAYARVTPAVISPQLAQPAAPPPVTMGAPPKPPASTFSDPFKAAAPVPVAAPRAAGPASTMASAQPQAAPRAIPADQPVGRPRAPDDRPSQSGGGGKVEVEMGIHSASNFYKGLGGNDVIEHGGIFVATYKVLKINAPVTLRVLLPGDYEFTATAVVQWTREGGTSEPGYGARFTQISAEGRQLVYRYTRNREPMFYDDL
jgi:hypothetical protein